MFNIAKLWQIYSVIRNIIFDWSGTLVDDLPAVLAATNHVFANSGRPAMSLDEFRAEFCLPFMNFYSKHTPHVPLPKLEEWFHQHFRRVQDLVTDLPHAREFLCYCRERGIRMFVLSTIHEEYFVAHTANNGFGGFFERAYLAVRDKRAKIAEVLRDNNLVPQETLFIGDMQHDIDTARHGGILSCGVLTGYNRINQLMQSDPHVVVEDLAELQKILHANNFEVKATTPLATRPISTVGALIFNSAGKVLMIQTHKWSNLWGIPGGKIELGEAAIDALRREILEETNLEVKNIRFVMVQDCIRSKEFHREAHFVLLNYTCVAKGNIEVKLNDEAHDFRWVSTDEAMTMDLNTPTRILMEKVLASKRRRNGSNHH